MSLFFLLSGLNINNETEIIANTAEEIENIEFSKIDEFNFNKVEIKTIITSKNKRINKNFNKIFILK